MVYFPEKLIRNVVCSCSMGRYDLSVLEPYHHMRILSITILTAAVAASASLVLTALGFPLGGLSVLELSVGTFFYTLLSAYAVYALWFTIDRHDSVLGSRPRVSVVLSTVVLTSALVLSEFGGVRPSQKPSEAL